MEAQQKELVDETHPGLLDPPALRDLQGSRIDC